MAAKSVKCAICGSRIPDPAPYPNLVCQRCDARALNERGAPALHDGQRPEFLRKQERLLAKSGGREILDPGDGGDNPVFIDGIRCWRRYRFGGWVTMRDDEKV